jgi:putative two-component system response regulator
MIDVVPPNKSSILVIDDTPANLGLLANLLRDQYVIRVANNGKKGLDLALNSPPDIILLDIMMPEMDGYEVCCHLKENPLTVNIPVIFLTAKSTLEDEEHGLSLGAVDFISKPISPPIVLARIKNHLKIKAWHDFLKNQNKWLQDEVERRLLKINHLQESSIWMMVALAEFRDECTGNHIRRVHEYVRILANKLAELPEYANILKGDVIDGIANSAPLHDIGKISTPDGILLKPGKLSSDEFEVMKQHAKKGGEIIKNVMGLLDKDNSGFLNFAYEIARYHHEKWDGSGYPEGLKGADIPLSARLMAVADVYDALRMPRPYKPPMSVEKTIEIILAGKGSHFDPVIVDKLLEVQDKFIAVEGKWPDIYG